MDNNGADQQWRVIGKNLISWLFRESLVGIFGLVFWLVLMDCWKQIAMCCRRPGKRSGPAVKYPNLVRVLHFPDQPPYCPAMEMYSRCNSDSSWCPLNHSPTASWLTICRLIQQAEVSVDIAVQVITSHRLTDILANLQTRKKKVRVRVFVDQEVMRTCKGTEYFSEKMAKSGVDVRTNGKVFANGSVRRYGTMHHKFVLVDSELLFTGSLNFTLHAVLQNHEDVVATTVADLVVPYRDYFDRLWSQLDAPWRES